MQKTTCKTTSDPEDLTREINQIIKTNVKKMRYSQNQNQTQSLQNANRFLNDFLKYTKTTKDIMDGKTNDPVRQYANFAIINDLYNKIKSDVKSWKKMEKIIGTQCVYILNQNIHTMHANTTTEMEQTPGTKKRKRTHDDDETSVYKQTKYTPSVNRNHTEKCKGIATSDPETFAGQVHNLIQFIGVQMKNKKNKHLLASFQEVRQYLGFLLAYANATIEIRNSDRYVDSTNIEEGYNTIMNTTELWQSLTELGIECSDDLKTNLQRMHSNTLEKIKSNQGGDSLTQFMPTNQFSDANKAMPYCTRWYSNLLTTLSDEKMDTMYTAVKTCHNVKTICRLLCVDPSVPGAIDIALRVLRPILKEFHPQNCNPAENGVSKNRCTSMWNIVTDMRDKLLGRQ